DAAQVHLTGDARDIQLDVHGDFAVIVHARVDLHIHADVNVIELRIDQRVDADAADAGLEAAGGGGLAVADLELGWDVIDRAELRALENLRGGVAEHGLQERVGDGGGEVGAGDASEVGERDEGAGDARRGAAPSAGASSGSSTCPGASASPGAGPGTCPGAAAAPCAR